MLPLKQYNNPNDSANDVTQLVRDILIAPHIVDVFVAFIHSHGGDANKVYRLCGIQRTVSNHDMMRVSHTQLVALLDAVADYALPKEPLSLQLLRYMPVTAMGNIGMASMTAMNLDEALNVGIRYMSLDFPFFSMRKISTGNTVRVVIKPLQDLGDRCNAVLAEIQVGMFNKMGFFAKHGPGSGKRRAMIGMEAHFRHTPQGDEEAYQHFFGITTRFNCADDQFIMSRHALKLPLMTHNQTNHKLITHILEQQLQVQSGQKNTTLRVRQLLRMALSEDAVTDAGEIAAQLSISTRTLTRRLGAEDTNLNRLVEEIRLEQAQLLLTDSDLPIAAIAKKVGFSSVSTFSRAFKRMVGYPPSTLRNQSKA